VNEVITDTAILPLRCWRRVVYCGFDVHSGSGIWLP
jgi:hypothetical protein